jgi:hypothetical protein
MTTTPAVIFAVSKVIFGLTDRTNIRREFRHFYVFPHGEVCTAM